MGDADLFMSKDELDFFQSLVRIELLLAELYGNFALRFREDADLWTAMAEEERAHARMLRDASSLFGADRNPQLRESNLFTVRRTAEGISQFVGERRDDASMTRVEALRAAMNMERSAAESHFHYVFSNLATSDQSALLTRLQEADKNHLERLQKRLDTAVMG